MDLEFTQNQRGQYEAKAEVNADFNIHLEIGKEKPSYIHVYVSTVSDGQPALVFVGNASEVFDRDFDAIVYPKYVTVITKEPVLRGVITEAT